MIFITNVCPEEINYVYPISRNDSEEKVNKLNMISIRDTKIRSTSTLLLIKQSIVSL